MSALLLVMSGQGVEAKYPLDEGTENLIGRDLECRVVLTDPRSSRVHAAIWKEDGQWWLEDRQSSNGTYVNGQKIDQAQLVEGTSLKIGNTRLKFHLGGAEAIPASDDDARVTILTDSLVPPDETGEFYSTAKVPAARHDDLFDLFKLTFRLLSLDDVPEVIRVSLNALRRRTQASAVGFLWLDDHGLLQPQIVIPEERSDEIELHHLISERISERRAIRIDPPLKKSERVNYQDAICVPLVDDDQVRGAVYLFRDQGRFTDEQCDWSLSLANVLVRALTRVRRQAMLSQEHQRLQKSLGDSDELIGDSECMQDLKSKIQRIARASGCVLIRGESGAGKELVARAIHRASSRGDRPMLSVNCAAIPSELMESQLFGHKRGAFTSADSDHIGYFQQADAGTLFLDEVGELTLEGQAKLLRILEGHPFLPVGATEEVRVNVRVIAATNRDLREYVQAKKFRDDLYYRLSVFELHVPPLRERGPDISRLIDHFLALFRHEHGRPELGLSPDALQRLLAYQWPGNVRQMRNVIDSAVVMAEGDQIEPEDLALHGTRDEELESLRIDHWERKLIQQALRRTEGNVPEAAKLLGISRATLYRKIDEYGIRR